ncbi:glycoside hydrolase family 3 N-terminal domain-containing protein [Erythrobacter sp. Alg231-14]|uniref:glycoside hydrolase family 3 N-terminal domain-containing protein n=1 Tax=Erythrobacter sp. Alg231-14 TaxID=1922225 RepID=UPI000D56255B
MIRAFAAMLLIAPLASCALTPDPVEERALEVLGKMTLEEKVGQIIQADISAVTPQEAMEYNLGSVLNGGNSAPGGGKTASPEAWIALANEYWEASTDTSDGGVGIPLLWGTDAVHGHNNLQSATIFPHNIGLGAANDPDLIGRIAQVTAREIRSTGLDWTFAPTLAVARDDRWGRTYESYSEDPQIVARYSAAMVEGLQGSSDADGFLLGENVIATAKHFIGDGGTQLGIDKGDTQGDLDELLELHGAGYAPAIDADVQIVMASFSSVNGRKMHGYRELLHDELRDELGFEGFVIGDWNGHGEIPGCTVTDCVAALDAGLDMYMAPDSWRGLYDNLLADAKSGELDLDRLDEAVVRILKVKIRAGLLDSVKPSERVTSDPAMLGREDHRAIAREAVRKSLVLLKNDGGVLPLQPGQTVLVTGSGADSVQQQSGGWTLNWQGTGNPNDEFAAAQTIFGGLADAMDAIGGNAVLSADGRFGTKPDVAVVVFGEEPYAEYRGDRSDLVYETEDGADLALLQSYQSQDIPVVAVFLSGRPLWVNPHLNASDAFVAAWLPGTEGAGVADVLVGDEEGKPVFDFAGRLSFTWPNLGDGEPINGPDAPNALFALGYGLTYGDASDLGAVSEDAGIDLSRAFSGVVMERGDAANGFSMYLGDSSNANSPLSALVGSSLSGAISTRGVDYKAQEDARVIEWEGNGQGVYSVRANRPIDVDTMSDGGSFDLLIEWNVLAAPSSAMELVLGCGEGCSGALDVTELVSNAAGAGWNEARVPLACFESAGLDPTKLKTPFGLRSSGTGEIAIHAVALEASPSPQVDCGMFN